MKPGQPVRSDGINIDPWLFTWTQFFNRRVSEIIIRRCLKKDPTLKVQPPLFWEAVVHLKAELVLRLRELERAHDLSRPSWPND